MQRLGHNFKIPKGSSLQKPSEGWADCNPSQLTSPQRYGISMEKEIPCLVFFVGQIPRHPKKVCCSCMFSGSKYRTSGGGLGCQGYCILGSRDHWKSPFCFCWPMMCPLVVRQGRLDDFFSVWKESPRKVHLEGSVVEQGWRHRQRAEVPRINSEFLGSWKKLDYNYSRCYPYYNVIGVLMIQDDSMKNLDYT